MAGCFRDHSAVTVTLLLLLLGVVSGGFSGIKGNYCADRQPVGCCAGREDTCSVPILGTLCYCDIFCNRTSGADCCPDFWEYCIGIPKPTPSPQCSRYGRSYYLGQTFKENCNICTCKLVRTGEYRIICEDKPCLIRPNLIEIINSGDHGWKASNYSFLWGKTLEEGIKYRLGTFRPTRTTLDMSEIHTFSFHDLPENFDARLRWATWLQPIRDQGDCGASWAFSSTAVASDRLSVMSGGLWKVRLSPQLLISCQSRGQRGCSGGHLDRAWWYLRKHGTSSERCYPYTSGITADPKVCKIKKKRSRDPRIPPTVRCIDGQEESIYRSTPPYRISSREEIIMQEVRTNGPVQATFQVREDFYSYRRGIYYHTRTSEHLPEVYRKTGWHSVRIMGWGVDKSRRLPVKYWLCANSWGSNWGEDGYFRILRGTNECDIESFVVGIWASQEDLAVPNFVGR